jgi:hypothetical protein
MASGRCAGCAAEATAVLFEADARIFDEAVGIGMESPQEALNFSADLFVPGATAVFCSNVTRFRPHFQPTPSSPPLLALP